MAEIDPNILIEISGKISGIDERTKSLQAADIQAQQNADHRHRNVMTAIENFVPRREIESMNAQNRAYAEKMAQDTRAHCDTNRDAVVGRVEKVEISLKEILDNSKWLKRALITAAIGAFLSAGAYAWNIIFVLKIASN